MLLDIATNLQQQLARRRRNKKHPTLQLVFFDGEEAVRDWSDKDSLYGSRHLAARMHRTIIPGQQNLNQIEAIDLFMLLDLIGDKNMKFVHFLNYKSSAHYNRLQKMETQLLRSYNDQQRRRPLFSSSSSIDIIGDDHIPFLHYDVPILHLISVPFPSTWHQSSENEASLDFATVRHFRNLMRIFVQDYLQLKKQFC